VRLGGSESPAARPPKVSPLAPLAVGTFVGSLDRNQYDSVAIARQPGERKNPWRTDS
jgi:hypothetical protein